MSVDKNDVQEVIAIVGSKSFKDFRAIRRTIADLEPGKKVLTGNIGAANLEIQACVQARGDLELEVVSAEKEGNESFANRKIIRACTRAIFFVSEDAGRANLMASLAATLGKPFQKIYDKVAV